MKITNHRKLWALAAAILLMMFIISGYVWQQIPAGQPVCTHWNAAGECDDYGSKFFGILLLPLVTTALIIVLPLLSKIDPRSSNIAQSSKAVSAVLVGLLLFMLAIHVLVMLQLLGSETNLGTYVPLLVGLLFVVIGNFLGKVRSNFFIGIRTPWTLSSELAWNKTHRLGGKLMMGLGILFMASTLFLQSEAWVFVLVGATAAMTLVLAAYSYLVWRNDADRVAIQ